MKIQSQHCWNIFRFRNERAGQGNTLAKQVKSLTVE